MNDPNTLKCNLSVIPTRLSLANCNLLMRLNVLFVAAVNLLFTVVGHSANPHLDFTNTDVFSVLSAGEC